MRENKNDNRNLSFKCKMKEVNLNRPFREQNKNNKRVSKMLLPTLKLNFMMLIYKRKKQKKILHGE